MSRVEIKVVAIVENGREIERKKEREYVFLLLLFFQSSQPYSIQ